jgi:hypothetical protein
MLALPMDKSAAVTLEGRVNSPVEGQFITDFNVKSTFTTEAKYDDFTIQTLIRQ